MYWGIICAIICANFTPQHSSKLKAVWQENVMKVVMLCGGLGTRLREETEYRPKPMVEVGSRPILWTYPGQASGHCVAREAE